MTKPPLCIVRDPETGALCGYRAQGMNAKELYADLFKHQQAHTDKLNGK